MNVAVRIIFLAIATLGLGEPAQAAAFTAFLEERDANDLKRQLVARSSNPAMYAECHANRLPVVGVVEQISIMENGPRVIARPNCVLTDQKLDKPTVFSGLQGISSTLTVVCCYGKRRTDDDADARRQEIRPPHLHVHAGRQKGRVLGRFHCGLTAQSS